MIQLRLDKTYLLERLENESSVQLFNMTDLVHGVVITNDDFELLTSTKQEGNQLIGHIQSESALYNLHRPYEIIELHDKAIEIILLLISGNSIKHFGLHEVLYRGTHSRADLGSLIITFADKINPIPYTPSPRTNTKQHHTGSATEH